jgi:type II secretory pathway pseudopilin PulG
MAQQQPARVPMTQIVLAIGIALMAFVLWRQQANLTQVRQQMEKLALENAALQQQTQAPATSAPGQPAEAAPLTETATPAAEAVATDAAVDEAEPAAPTQRREELVATPTGPAPMPRSTGLMLAGTHAAPTEGGQRVTMKFTPTTTEPLGIIALVVRLPRDSASRILDLAPEGSMAFANVSKRISDDGKFAVYHGTPESIAAIEFALSVSGTAVADVRGTCGIGAFDLSFGPGGTTVTPKP